MLDPRVAEALAEAQRDEYSAFTMAWLAWLTSQAMIQTDIVNHKDISSAHSNAECNAVWRMIRTPAPLPWMIRRKLTLLRNIMEDGSRWTDHRDVMLLASIDADFEEMSGDGPAPEPLAQAGGFFQPCGSKDDRLK